MIEDLWTFIQSSPMYKNKTTLIVTCGHGRGDNPKKNWTDHGEKIADAGQIWIGALGPNIRQEGEIETKEVLYQDQLAATFAKILGLNFTSNHPVTQPIEGIYK